ncbi:flagellar type III secretion system pore protein FliP [Tessaracoccus sp.]
MTRATRYGTVALALVALVLIALVAFAHPAEALQLAPAPPRPPATPTPPVTVPGAGDISISVGGGKPSNAITLILALTVLSIAPALLLLTTSFTKIIVVLSLTRNALGLQQSPPNQVLTGLALFMTLFIMGPTLATMNDTGIQPYLHGSLTASQAYDVGVKPLRTFMLHNTRKEELALFTRIAKEQKPASGADVSMTTLIPAFALSELKSAFIIGMIIFIPFLVIDMLVSATLMSMGMMMVPPIIVSLPFKLLIFVMVDGWALIVKALVSSYA